MVNQEFFDSFSHDRKVTEITPVERVLLSQTRIIASKFCGNGLVKVVGI